jgi:cytochrome c556
MRHGAWFVSVVVAGVALGVTLPPLSVSAAAAGEEVIKARINFMEDEIGDHWKVLANFAKNGNGTLQDVEKNALALAVLAKKIPGHFAKNTGRGDFPDHVTRALPAIWKDWPGFEQQVKQFADGSIKLASLAKAGDKDAVVKMIGPSGSYNRTEIGCAECHEKFRGPRVKK